MPYKAKVLAVNPNLAVHEELDEGSTPVFILTNTLDGTEQFRANTARGVWQIAADAIAVDIQDEWAEAEAAYDDNYLQDEDNYADADPDYQAHLFSETADEGAELPLLTFEDANTETTVSVVAEFVDGVQVAGAYAGA